MLDIYIPTFNRSTRLPFIHDQILSTPGDFRVWYILEKTDNDSLELCREHKLCYIINHRSPTYAGAINSAWDCLHSKLLFAGADDLEFLGDWLSPLLLKVQEGHQVVGTNDGGGNEEVKRGEHATHYLVTGTYIWDQGGVVDTHDAPVLYEGYSHNYTDREFIGTAKFRGVFSPCLESMVKHNHYSFGRSAMDDTYRKGLQLVDQDEKLYQSRRSLWKGL